MSDAGAGGPPDFNLPDPIRSLIPTDPYEQLDLARRITGMAIASRVTGLEAEAGRLRQGIAERDRAIGELQGRLSQLERAVQDSDARLRAVLEENIKLTKERDMLTATTKKLGRDLAKLETFKRHLMQSLSDDNSSQQTETSSIQPDQSTASSPSWKDEVSSNQTESDIVSNSAEIGDYAQNERNAPHNSSSTPYATPWLTPTSTPKGSSTGGTPRGFTTAGSSPKFLTGNNISPTKSRFEGHTSLSPWYPSSQRPSAPSSPPQGRSLSGRPRVDGKEFFRQARSRLSYEQFGAFLANIKELNAKRQSREETLVRAEEIFGSENKDLFLSFQGLLSSNIA